MSIYRCNTCCVKYSNEQVICHPVARTVYVCDLCYESSEAAQAAVARYEDQCDDAKCEDKINSDEVI